MRARINGYLVVVIGGEFGFLAGSVGQSAADRVVAGYQAATADSLPVITLPTSGGTRMQEERRLLPDDGHRLGRGGTPAHWRDPGGVAAQPYDRWSHGDLGFLRRHNRRRTRGTSRLPRSEGLRSSARRALPPVQTAENLARVGVIDQVVALGELREWVSGILDVVYGDDEEDEFGDHGVPEPVDAWEAITRTRDADRPGPPAVLDLMSDRTELHGTGAGESGGGIRLALGRLRGVRTLVVAQTREEVSPAGLRVAQRGLRLADRVGLPVITLIDTPGGELSGRAEESAMAGEIARTLQTMSGLSVPSVSCVMGQGCGGRGAGIGTRQRGGVHGERLGLPPPPEGASVITHRTPDRAAEMARQQGVGAESLVDAEVVDEVAAEGSDLPRPSRMQ